MKTQQSRDGLKDYMTLKKWYWNKELASQTSRSRQYKVVGFKCEHRIAPTEKRYEEFDPRWLKTSEDNDVWQVGKRARKITARAHLDMVLR